MGIVHEGTGTFSHILQLKFLGQNPVAAATEAAKQNIRYPNGTPAMYAEHFVRTAQCITSGLRQSVENGRRRTKA